jgi:alpha-D-xyloside xylohydrolase
MQYMLGDALLVAPIFNDQGEATYYLPAGEWRHLLTGATVTGGTWRTETYDYFGLPLWVNTERGAAWKCLEGFRADPKTH